MAVFKSIERKTKDIKGYTVLEALLVIAIAAIFIIPVGRWMISLRHNELLNEKALAAQKERLEMQAIIQAYRDRLNSMTYDDLQEEINSKGIKWTEDVEGKYEATIEFSDDSKYEDALCDVGSPAVLTKRHCRRADFSIVSKENPNARQSFQITKVASACPYNKELDENNQCVEKTIYINLYKCLVNSTGYFDSGMGNSGTSPVGFWNEITPPYYSSTGNAPGAYNYFMVLPKTRRTWKSSDYVNVTLDFPKLMENLRRYNHATARDRLQGIQIDKGDALCLVGKNQFSDAQRIKQGAQSQEIVSKTKFSMFLFHGLGDKPNEELRKIAKIFKDGIDRDSEYYKNKVYLIENAGFPSYVDSLNSWGIAAFVGNAVTTNFFGDYPNYSIAHRYNSCGYYSTNGYVCDTVLYDHGNLHQTVLIDIGTNNGYSRFGS